MIAVAVGSEWQWPRFCDALGLTGLAEDPRFATNGDRVERRAELRPILAARFLERDTAAWLSALEAADVPCGPIRDIVEAFASPEAAALGMTVELDAPRVGRDPPGRGAVRAQRDAGDRSGSRRPRSGQDSDAVLGRPRLHAGRDRGAPPRRRDLTARLELLAPERPGGGRR